MAVCPCCSLWAPRTQNGAGTTKVAPMLAEEEKGGPGSAPQPPTRLRTSCEAGAGAEEGPKHLQQYGRGLLAWPKCRRLLLGASLKRTHSTKNSSQGPWPGALEVGLPRALCRRLLKRAPLGPRPSRRKSCSPGSPWDCHRTRVLPGSGDPSTSWSTRSHQVSVSSALQVTRTVFPAPVTKHWLCSHRRPRPGTAHGLTRGAQAAHECWLMRRSPACWSLCGESTVHAHGLRPALHGARSLEGEATTEEMMT